ncbi:hypothetical protein SLOPH_1030 [Spraguea lophii 42_110]|uniref:Nucleotide-sugar transporter n=1 Tax=Spraguea lophii (strain 42_110) TaxID=1358809 RepID=S7XS54_SPRLO|nr:hypothetical protein SLOPH_1030 [Spraguea lophii 42_110]
MKKKILFSIIFFLKLLCGIIHLKTKIRTKSSAILPLLSQIYLIPVSFSLRKQTIFDKKFLIIVPLTIIAKLSYWYSHSYTKPIDMYIPKTLEIVIISLGTFLILKKRLLKLQYLGISMIIIGNILNITISSQNIQFNYKFWGIYVTYTLIPIAIIFYYKYFKKYYIFDYLFTFEIISATCFTAVFITENTITDKEDYKIFSNPRLYITTLSKSIDSILSLVMAYHLDSILRTFIIYIIDSSVYIILALMDIKSFPYPKLITFIFALLGTFIYEFEKIKMLFKKYILKKTKS